MNNLDIKLYEFPSICDKREQGVLRVFESDNLPFIIKRVFSVVNAIGGSKRGQHAHKICNQLICCVAGEVNLKCDDGNTQTEILLSSENEALFVPCGIWAEQNYIIDNSVIIVFCDQSYDENDYIRDYEAFIKWKKNKNF
jgi:UDP-2-acetamido-3-amino-2,3-dideoxy-glucuronate N-acetyltransferase